jgi:hypothetical protein
MTYADPMRRRDLIIGLHMLADLLEDEPEIPAPYNVNVLVFPADVSDDDGRAEVDRIAGRIDVNVDDGTAEYGHYSASRVFGPSNTGLSSFLAAPALITTRGTPIQATSFPVLIRRGDE